MPMQASEAQLLTAEEKQMILHRRKHEMLAGRSHRGGQP